MDNNNYVRSHAYEGYIRLARLCGRDDFHARNSYMQNLLNAEEGKNYTRYTYSQLLTEVKKAMSSATNDALKRRRLSREDKVIALSYLARIDEAMSGEILLQICEEGCELFFKYKPAP